MGIKHDDMIKDFIDLLEACPEFKPKSITGDTVNCVKIETEVPFCHYGFRGVVDVVQSLESGSTKCACLFELKTKLLDIGKTVRQVKLAMEYFPKCNRTKYTQFLFTLVILGTKSNIEAIERYNNMFPFGDNFNIYIFFPGVACLTVGKNSDIMKEIEKMKSNMDDLEIVKE